MSTSQRNSGRASGHVKLVERQRGEQWYVKFRRPDGKQVIRRLGPAFVGKLKRGERVPAGFFTKELAEAELHSVLAEAERSSAAGEGDATAATFEEATEEYLRYVEEVKRIDAACVRDYRGVIDGYLLPEFGKVRLEAITPDLIDAYKERLISEGRLSNRVIVRHLTVLHGIFKRARRVYGLAENPASAELVERPRVVYSGAFETYSREEIELLAAAANAQDAAIYRVAAFTGLRQGELLGLRWAHVDFVGGLLHVQRNYTDKRDKVPKSKRVRSVPMMPEVIDALGRLKERDEFTADDDLVFCKASGEYEDAFALRRRFYKAIKTAGLRRIRFHDLRHGFGTTAISVLDAYSVQSYMGHAHYSTTQRYLHHKPRREDAQKLHEAFVQRDQLGQRPVDGAPATRSETPS